MPQRLIMCTVLEPFTKQDSVSSWIPSKDRIVEIYWKIQKAPLWQEAVGNTRTGMHAHKETVETVLVGQWEYVSAYYLLWFQLSTFLGFIMWKMHRCRLLEVRSATQTEGFFISGLQSAESSGEKGRGGQRKICWAILFPILLSFPALCFFFCCAIAEKIDGPILSLFFTLRGKCFWQVSCPRVC